MADPLDILSTPVEPVRPSEAFAARLRDRLERALSLPEGVAVSDLTLTETQTAPGPAGFPRPGALPYLSVRDAQAAIDWYVNAFDAELVGAPYLMPDGKIGHATLAIGDAYYGYGQYAKAAEFDQAVGSMPVRVATRFGTAFITPA